MLIGRFSFNGKRFYGNLDLNEQKIYELKTPYDLQSLTGNFFLPEEIEIKPPCLPTKVICVGLNYRDHAEEFSLPVPEEPILFLKPPSAITGHEMSVVYPAMSKQVDYEAELAVVIAKEAKNIPLKKTPEHILGLTCANDITARDLQTKDGQWTRAKSFDTFSPLGPYINTELDPSNLHINLQVNGEVRQKSNTENLIFSVYELVSFISHIMTLLPGDVILTGTPSGVGPLHVGDEVTVFIEGIGALNNHVIA